MIHTSRRCRVYKFIKQRLTKLSIEVLNVIESSRVDTEDCCLLVCVFFFGCLWFVFVFVFALWLRVDITTSPSSQVFLSTNVSPKACLYNVGVGIPFSGASLTIYMQDCPWSWPACFSLHARTGEN